MPALNYDYDYYDYVNSNRKSNAKTVPVKKMVQSNCATSQNTRVKPQTRKKKNIDIEIKPRVSTRNLQKPQAMKLQKPKSNVKLKKKSNTKAIFFIIVGFAAFFMICYRYSLINENFLAVNDLKDELEDVKTVNEQIRADIENNTDLTYVENYAKYQLGMQKPSTSQIKYVNVEKEDKIVSPVVIEEEKQDSIFYKIVNEIKKFID